MTIEASLKACEETVRRADPDRYFSALFAPAERRPLLFALYAFNRELARIGETVKEPMLADIRFEWWREAVEGARDGRPRAHDVVRGLAELFARSGPPIEPFETMIAARRFDVGQAAFNDLASLEDYADATSGAVMRIAARLLDERVPDYALLRQAGQAYALAGLLRAAPMHAARGKSYYPRALVEAGGEEHAIAIISKTALAHHAAARSRPKPGRAFAAVLPATLVPLYAKHAGDPARRGTDISLYRRQWAMLRAAIRGRV
ncbi:MAG TPA: phytoene/squalene synthase family protein [Rhizomicrobium sp.]|nr:phytoene/squalene synthase family protein [Rhizomicrobium sp.]